MPEPHLRAGDTDREAVATILGQHMAAGRLTLAEYDERLVRAYAARTFGELAELTTDLPAPAPVAARPAPEPAEAAAAPATLPRPAPPLVAPPGMPAPPMAPWGRHAHAEHSWRAWLTTSAIVLVVYLASSLANGNYYFWPIWVIGPWGAVLLASRVGGGGRDRNRRRPGR